MNKNWFHVLFVAVCATVLVVLLRAPDIQTPRLPADADHADSKAFAACPACHGAGSDAPMPDDHLAGGEGLRADHAKCYFCHKPGK